MPQFSIHVLLGAVALGILARIVPGQAVPLDSLWQRASPEVRRLRALLKAKALLHPSGGAANFCHLASALARCCGVHAPELARYSNTEQLKVEKLATEIGTARQHLVRFLLMVADLRGERGKGICISYCALFACSRRALAGVCAVRWARNVCYRRAS